MANLSVLICQAADFFWEPFVEREYLRLSHSHGVSNQSDRDRDNTELARIEPLIVVSK